MWKYHTDGLITFITFEHLRIADLLPMLVCSLEELVEIECGRRASSGQCDPLHEPSVDPPYHIDQPRMVPYRPSFLVFSWCVNADFYTQCGAT